MIFEVQEKYIKKETNRVFYNEISIIELGLTEIEKSIKSQEIGITEYKKNLLMWFVVSNIKSFSSSCNLIQTGYLSDAFIILRKIIECLYFQLYFMFQNDNFALSYLNEKFKPKSNDIQEIIKNYVLPQKVINCYPAFFKDFYGILYTANSGYIHFDAANLKTDLSNNKNLYDIVIGPNWDQANINICLNQLITFINIQLDILHFQGFSIMEDEYLKIKEYLDSIKVTQKPHK